MIPTALELGPLATVAAGFVVGVGGLYLFDLAVNGGSLVGEHADQRRLVRRRRWRGSSSRVVVLAGGTSIEQLAEGLVIGVGASVEPSLAVVVALAIGIDNLGEGMGIGELVRDETPEASAAWRRTVAWTAAIGLSLFGASMVGWLALRDLPAEAVGALLSAGGGAMLYLTWSSLLPEGEARQYQGSATLASGAAFALMLVLTAIRG
jgi:ZIP family zinc transporter